jgi:hypothetical protein
MIVINHPDHGVRKPEDRERHTRFVVLASAVMEDNINFVFVSLPRPY